MKQLNEDFFKRDAFIVALELIGKILAVRQPDGRLRSLRIIETEVCYGVADSARHARFGRSCRAGVMYEEGGALYIDNYQGTQHLLNFVTGEKDYPQGVMIRACLDADDPGRLTKFLGITAAWHGRRLDDLPELMLFDDGRRYETERLPRLGLNHAKAEDRAKLWRCKAVLPE